MTSAHPNIFARWYSVGDVDERTCYLNLIIKIDVDVEEAADECRRVPGQICGTERSIGHR